MHNFFVSEFSFAGSRLDVLEVWIAEGGRETVGSGSVDENANGAKDEIFEIIDGAIEATSGGPKVETEGGSKEVSGWSEDGSEIMELIIKISQCV